VRQQLVWRDREGKKLGVIGQAQDEILYPVLSPDGLRVAVTGMENNNLDVWVHEVARPVKNRLTFEPASDMHAKWLPGGKEIVFSSQRAGTFDIYAQAADGSGQARLLAATPAQELVSDCSPDGKYILYTVDDPKTNFDIRYLKRRPAGEAFDSLPFLHAQFNEQIPRLSPDGRLVAYVSDESGRNEIYVRPFPEGEGKWQVSTSGGTQPRWSRDGKELFYVEGATLMVVPVASEERFSAGPAKRLFEDASLPAPAAIPRYEVSADGRRFLLVETIGGEDSRPPAIHVVEHWFAEFRERKEGGK
jgi:Tol biopolymer transport system component